jgi:hypothetical protein
MRPQYLWLQSAGYNFRLPNPTFALSGAAELHFNAVSPGVQAVAAETSSSRIIVEIADQLPNATIFFTTAGKDPAKTGKRYASPLHLTLAPGEQLRIVATAVLPDGRASSTSALVVRRTSQ